MKRLALTLLGSLALAATALPPSRLLAQAIQTPLIVERNGKQLTNEATIYGTAGDCDDDNEFTFKATYTTAAPVVELWVGQSGKDSSTAANRKNETSSTNPPCKLLDVVKESTVMPSITTTAGKLFSIGWDDTKCDESSGQTYTAYLIPLMTPTNRGSNTADEPISVGTNISTLKAVFTLYTKRPSTPSNIKPLTGESELGVSFDPLSGAPAKTSYRVYFDWGTSADHECGSGALIGEEIAPDTGGKIASVDTNSGEGKLKKLGSKGIKIGDLVAVSVVTVDPSKSESVLSEPICVARVETDGPLPICQRDPNCKNQFDTCSVHRGADRGPQSASALLFAGLGIALALRRRHV